MSSKREKDRPDLTPEQLAAHSEMYKRQTFKIGKGKEMAYVRGVLTLLDVNRPRVPVSLARFRDKKRHQQGE
jgi:hypothetical protein